MITSWLTVEKTATSYEISVREADSADSIGDVVAEGSIPLQLPRLPGMDDDPIEVLSTLLVTQGAYRVEPEIAGNYLYALLADHGLGDWLDQVRGSETGTRRTFLSVTDESLRRLPWELLLEPRSQWAPFVRPDNSWTRVLPELVRQEPLAPPLRVLFVAGAYDDVKLYADDELDAVMRVLCHHPAEWHFEYLVAPTKEKFDSTYAEMQPHVLHVVAHGEMSRGKTVLSFRAGLDGAWSITPIQVSNGLATCPRLVVLNACRSGLAGASTAAAWSFADLFLEKGAGAVVTMQGDIPAIAGVAFTEAFYGALVTHHDVDVAAQLGRHAVFGVSDAPQVWSIPTVTLRATPSAVLGTHESRPAPTPLPLVAVIAEAVGYVDRAPERRSVWHRVVPDQPVDPPRLIIVTGGRETGKSAVVKGALPACYARGSDIAYIDFGPSTRLNWLGAVKRVHEDLSVWLPEYDDALDRFAHIAESMRIGPHVATEEPARLTMTPKAPFLREEDLGDNRKKRIFRELSQLIETCAGHNRLVLVLDHLFTGLSDDARDDYILPRFVQPLLDNPHSRVTLVAVLPKDHDLQLSIPADMSEPVEVPLFEKSTFELLLREYVARRQSAGSLPPEQKQLVKMLAGQGDSWLPSKLVVYGEAAAAAGRHE